MVTEALENDQIILATGGYDHTIKLWQTPTGICHRTMQHAESQVNALEITPDKKLLAAASYQHIYMYDLLSNDPNAIVNYEGTSKNVTCIGFQEDGKWMYSGGEDGRTRIWDLRSKKDQNQYSKSFDTRQGHGTNLSPINCAVLHPNQVELFIGDQNGIIYRWDLRTDNNEQFIPENDVMILGIDISPDGSQMACVNNKGRAYIWNLTAAVTDQSTILKPRHKFEAHKRAALKCKYSPDSSMLVTTSADTTARIWDTEEYNLKQELKQDMSQRWVWDAAWSSDSQYIFTASSDNFAKLWNIETGNLERTYSGHQKATDLEKIKH
ncbi:target of rapamycin complex subunit lst8 isoform X2 [Anthonomus grandis grandis]|uniref:target of rapamycin complex subunit lst8 isoform X2 n=1 Tax=Anthonomus grandis grandis TaxID=2921223 RepID=UPI002164FD50|nr:target of rapamycin complex subunit lst8 isoform X2 [Anthonomus grandis grandis]